MAFQIDHTVDAIRNYALFFICKCGPLGGSIVTQSLDEITDELKGVRGGKQVTKAVLTKTVMKIMKKTTRKKAIALTAKWIKTGIS